MSLFSQGNEYVFHAEQDGGVVIRDHKCAALLRNRNRLSVIVRQNKDRRRGREVRREPCHSMLLQNYRICASERKQCLLNPECPTRHGFEATDAASIPPMITIADTGSVSRCYVTTISSENTLSTFYQCKGIVAVFADWHVVRFWKSNVQSIF